MYPKQRFYSEVPQPQIVTDRPVPPTPTSPGESPMSRGSGTAVTPPKPSMSEPPLAGEPYLLTPGPLTTSASVKRAMLRDWGSGDGAFRAMPAELRRRLRASGGNSQGRRSEERRVGEGRGERGDVG